MDNSHSFNYERAFCRNLGWLTHFEQQALRGKRVAIAGLGGVGGAHLLTLARLGIGAFTLADFDRFELANFNRQAGATVSSLGHPKLDVLHAMALDINPELRIRAFDKGVQLRDVDWFLQDADLYVDALDFFAIDIRRQIFARCDALGIPAITAAPVGMGCAMLYFKPGGMRFEQWFRFKDTTEPRQAVNFAMGLAPSAKYRDYLMDASSANMPAQQLPSTGLACDLCAGMVAAQAVKILLQRGRVDPVPNYYHFDAYQGRFKKARLPGGNGHWLQRVRLALGYRYFERNARNTSSSAPWPTRTIERILDAARWAPSGDNTQPWRFRIVNDHQLTVLVQHDENFYESLWAGKGVWLAVGGLLETLRIAASPYRLNASWELRQDGDQFALDVTFVPSEQQRADPLQAMLVARSVVRHAYRLTPLTAPQKERLQLAVGTEFELVWHESWQERLRASRLNLLAAHIRLSLPQAWQVHQEILDWQCDFSPDRLPVRSIPTDPLTRRLMRWVLKTWARTDFFNRYLAGTRLPALEMELWPGLNCAAHFVMRFRADAPDTRSIAALLRAGQAMQRFWLQATAEGLVLQPSFSALMLALYPDHPSARAPQLKAAQGLAQGVRAYAQAELSHIAFLGRVGTPKTRVVKARSLRRSWQELTLPS